MSHDRSLLLNRRVPAALVLEVVGYAALLAIYPHSEPSAVAEALQAVPAVVLVLLALPAIPAIALTIAVGAVLATVGLPPESIPAILLARGDVLFFACAYAVAVASGPVAHGGFIGSGRYLRAMPTEESSESRRVLVTGATGVLGHRLVERLANYGHDVVGLVRDDEGADRVERRGGTAVEGDVLEPGFLEDLEPPEVLVHAATAIPTSDKPTDEEWERNDRVRLDGARNLVDAMGEAVEHVLFPSVVWVARQPDGSAFDEGADRHPDRATRSAAATEDLLRGTAESTGFDLSVLRCGFFYAPDAAHTRDWGERLLERRLPVVGGGLLGRRDAALSFVHADDAARAFVAAVDAGATGRYHVVDDEPVTPADFLRTFAALLDAPAPRRIPSWLARFFVGEVAADTLSSPMPTTSEKLRVEVGWEPQYPTYREGLRAVVETWLDEGTLRETDEGYAWAG